MAGNYNVNTYNSALYNAGRDEIGAVARSIIQAHTGPHIQAVVGSDPRLPAEQSGISFISDFNIIEGTVRKPPTSFYFPDLRARLNALQTGQKDLAALLQAIQRFDMPACVFPVAFLPDLGAIIFGFIEADLPAFIFGELAKLDLPAIIQIVQEDLGGQILGIAAPNLPAEILSIAAPTLGAIIWSPHDLPALLVPVSFDDLPGSIRGFQYKDLGGNMLGISAPTLNARIKGFAAAQANLPAAMFSRMESVLPATVTASIPGPNDIVGIVDGGTGGYQNLLGLIRRADPGSQDLIATIGKAIAENFDLQALIDFLSATNLPADIYPWLLGEHDKFLPATLQPVYPADISASIESNENLKDLGAYIESLFGYADLGGFIRAAETFVTAILTVSTYSTANLRATIGNPDCAGGSASLLLSAIATAQQAKDLGGFIQSFLEANLGATINQKEIFYAMDTIDVKFTPKGIRTSTFLTTDTIDVNFSPFRGLNLGAFIRAVLTNADLAASITAQIPLPRVEPAINRLTAAEIRPDRAFDTQEIRIQMEGQLLNYFYANGTEDAFIQDADETWRINVRGFRPIADGLFGEFASARVCRLGNLESYSSLDGAMRACIAAVIGQEGEGDLGATIAGSGGTTDLVADLTVSNIFDNLGAIVNRVFPVDMGATVSGVDIGKAEIPAVITPVVSTFASLAATIDPGAEGDLAAYANPSGGYLSLGGTVKWHTVSSLTATITVDSPKYSILLNDSVGQQKIGGPDLQDINLTTSSENMSFAFWMKPDPIDFDTFDVILGATSSFATWTNGFGFYFNSSTSVRFWMNAYTTDFINGSFPSRLQWTHVVGTYDETLGSQNMKLYINGELAGTHNYTGGLDTQTVTYTIGELGNSGHSSTYYYQGLIEDPAIWSRTLSANEVAEIYSNGLGGFNLLSSGTYYAPTDLELWYDFDNTVSLDTFPFIKDRSSNGENGFYVFAPVDQFDVLVSGTPVDNNVSMDTTGLAYYYTDTGTNGVPVSGTGSFSIMAVVKNANTAFNAVVGAWNSGQTGTEGSFRITKTNATYSHVTDWAITNSSETAKYGNFNSGTDLTDTVWYNWVFTYDAVSGRCSGYENGVLVSQQILPGTRKSWTEFLVGARRYADTISNQWVGNIDTVAVWDKELQQGEIDEIYNNNESEVRLDKLNNSSNLRAWYRLGESGDTTSVMHDRSGNGYHLALQGGSATIVAVTPN